jgi:curli biogenesis system outer membrane secretion channel CsgG
MKAVPPNRPEPTMNLNRPRTMLRLAPLGAVLLAAACTTTTPVRPDPNPMPGTRTGAMATPPQLAHRGERVAVSIYEFRSSVNEINARGATDMFKTALLANGRFQLVERARLSEGVIREKQLNAAGQSTGSSAQRQVRAAEYIFEASITELSAGDQQSQGGINIGGMQLGGAANVDSLGIDVRIVDASNGDVRDALSLRRPLKSSATQVSGIAALVQTVQGMRGRAASPLLPDVNLQTTRKDSVDRALRGLIDDAVAQLAARF